MRMRMRIIVWKMKWRRMKWRRMIRWKPENQETGGKETSKSGNQETKERGPGSEETKKLGKTIPTDGLPAANGTFMGKKLTKYH